MKRNIAILLVLLIILPFSGCTDLLNNSKEPTNQEVETPIFQKLPRIHLTHEHYLEGTNITTLQISGDTLFFNSGMRTTDYSGFYIYAIPNESTPKYCIHSEAVEYTVESVLIGDNMKTATKSTLHLFLPEQVMENIVRQGLDSHTGLSGLIGMVWIDQT